MESAISLTYNVERNYNELNEKEAIMEKLGGGGHFISAAAQLDASYDEALELLKKTIQEYLYKDNEEE